MKQGPTRRTSLGAPWRTDPGLNHIVLLGEALSVGNAGSGGQGEEGPPGSQEAENGLRMVKQGGSCQKRREEHVKRELKKRLKTHSFPIV